MSPKFMETWFRMMADAMHGTSEAQDAIKSFQNASKNSEAMNNWMQQFFPSGSMADFDKYSDFYEDWLRSMGMVPRQRYLEALERNEILRTRIEDAEKTIQKLRNIIDGKAQGHEEAEKVLNLWDSMFKDTLKAQSEWMKKWSTQQNESDTEEEKDN